MRIWRVKAHTGCHSGPAHPSRLLPTWTMIWPNSGKPEVGGAATMCNCISGNDEDHVIRIDISGSPSSLHNITSPVTTRPTVADLAEQISHPAFTANDSDRVKAYSPTLHII